MSVFTAGMYERMRDDTALIDMLGNGRHSILTGEEIPPDSAWPLVWSWGFSAFEDGGVKNKGGVQFTKDLIALSRIVSSTVEVGAIAERLRKLFNRKPFAIAGFTTLVVEAHGPRSMPSDENVTALVVPVTVHAMEV